MIDGLFCFPGGFRCNRMPGIFFHRASSGDSTRECLRNAMLYLEHPHPRFKNLSSVAAHANCGGIALAEVSRERDHPVQMEDFLRKLLVQFGNFPCPGSLEIARSSLDVFPFVRQRRIPPANKSLRPFRRLPNDISSPRERDRFEPAREFKLCFVSGRARLTGLSRFMA